jgi:hypothetical protein
MEGVGVMVFVDVTAGRTDGGMKLTVGCPGGRLHASPLRLGGSLEKMSGAEPGGRGLENRKPGSGSQSVPCLPISTPASVTELYNIKVAFRFVLAHFEGRGGARKRR